MIRMALGLSACLFMVAAQCCGQTLSRMDSIPADSFFQRYEFYLDIPIGQTFINKNSCQSFHKVRFHAPESSAKTHIAHDTVLSRRALRTQVSMMTSNTTTYMASASNSSGTQVTMRGTMSVNDDPTKYLAEVRPAIHQPLVFDMQLGHGSAWLDLTDLRVRGINIESSNADIFLSYKKPNPEKMQTLRLASGMSKIVFRNLEYARAEKIFIDNGMGDTKIIIGEKVHNPAMLEIGVGAGACIMMVHNNAPMKLILENSLFASKEIPENFIPTGDNTYVNLAYKKNPSKGITAVIDLGIGTFTLITY